MESETESLVAVVVDDPFARDAMCQMLNTAAIPTIPISGSEEECLNVIEDKRPLVLITDLHTGDDANAETAMIRQTRFISPRTACLVLFSSDPTGTLLTDTLLAGAQGCVRKGGVSHLGLPALVKRLMAGEYIIDPLLAAEPRPLTGTARGGVHRQVDHFWHEPALQGATRESTLLRGDLWAQQDEEEMAPWPTKNTLG